MPVVVLIFLALVAFAVWRKMDGWVRVGCLVALTLLVLVVALVLFVIGPRVFEEQSRMTSPPWPVRDASGAGDDFLGGTVHRA